MNANTLPKFEEQPSLQQWHSEHAKVDQKLRSGPKFHYGKDTDKKTALLKGEVNDRFRLIVVTNGSVDIAFGSRSFCLTAESQQPKCGKHTSSQSYNAALVSLKKPVTFSRKTLVGNHSERVSIGVSQEWLKHAFSSSEYEDAINKWEHLGVMQWQASSKMIQLAKELLNPNPCPAMLKGIYRESRAVELVLNTFARGMMGNSPVSEMNDGTLVPKKWLAFRGWLQQHAVEPLTVDELANKMNMTQSTLQRQFKLHFNETLFECIQSMRLNLSMDMLKKRELSITAIALQVGYGSSASFSVAFKRFFGMTPSEARFH